MSGFSDLVVDLKNTFQGIVTGIEGFFGAFFAANQPAIEGLLSTIEEFGKGVEGQIDGVLKSLMSLCQGLLDPKTRQATKDKIFNAIEETATTVIESIFIAIGKAMWKLIVAIAESPLTFFEWAGKKIGTMIKSERDNPDKDYRDIGTADSKTVGKSNLSAGTVKDAQGNDTLDPATKAAIKQFAVNKDHDSLMALMSSTLNSSPKLAPLISAEYNTDLAALSKSAPPSTLQTPKSTSNQVAQAVPVPETTPSDHLADMHETLKGIQDTLDIGNNYTMIGNKYAKDTISIAQSQVNATKANSNSLW